MVVIAARSLSLAERRPIATSRRRWDELFTDLRDATLAPDDSLVVHVSVSAECGRTASRASWTLDALDVSLRSAGFERTQHVSLEPAQRFDCH